MPGGDRTGPRGLGPMTGRAAGFCAGNDRPGYANPGPAGGLGYGRGRGGGRGRGWGRGVGRGAWGGGGRGAGPWYGPPAAAWGSVPPLPAPASEAETRQGALAALAEEAASLRLALEDVQRRLEELKDAG